MAQETAHWPNRLPGAPIPGGVVGQGQVASRAPPRPSTREMGTLLVWSDGSPATLAAREMLGQERAGLQNMVDVGGQELPGRLGMPRPWPHTWDVVALPDHSAVDFRYLAADHRGYGTAILALVHVDTALSNIAGQLQGTTRLPWMATRAHLVILGSGPPGPLAAMLSALCMRAPPTHHGCSDVGADLHGGATYHGRIRTGSPWESLRPCHPRTAGDPGMPPDPGR